MDQFVLTPCVLTIFFTAQSLLELKGFGEAQRRIRENWWPTLQRNWGVWIPVQAINFSIVPVHLRLLTVNFVSLLYVSVGVPFPFCRRDGSADERVFQQLERLPLVRQRPEHASRGQGCHGRGRLSPSLSGVLSIYRGLCE